MEQVNQTEIDVDRYEALHPDSGENEQKDQSPAAIALRRKIMLRAVIGEFICTCLFMFTVCSAAINFAATSATVSTNVDAALVTGFAGISLIYAFADISGAHFNPAVTLATWLSGKTSNRKSLLYVLAQILGAMLAMIIVMLCFPNAGDVMAALAITPPDGVHYGHVFMMEFMLTFILVFVIFTVAFEMVSNPTTAVAKFKKTDQGLTLYTATPQSKLGFAPLAIGTCLGFLCMLGGSVSGGAFNPARVFAPAVFSGKFDGQWLYWLGDLLGAASAVGVRKVYRYYFGKLQMPTNSQYGPVEVNSGGTALIDRGSSLSISGSGSGSAEAAV